MMPFHTYEIEREFRLRAIKLGAQESFQKFQKALNRIETGDTEHLLETWDYARSVPYKHAGLSSESYLAHPLRVATIVLQVTEPPSVDAAALALLHNILEVTELEESSVAQSWGDPMVEALRTLTVDRSRQNESAYKREYYDKISRAPLRVKIVKVIDKFDNLFLLNLNPDKKIKILYLNEIEKEILPLVKGVLPGLLAEFQTLIKEVRSDIDRSHVFE